MNDRNESGRKVTRHSLTTRLTHWLGALAMFVLFFSGLQIFNAAPFLDASNASDPAKRVLSIQGGMNAQNQPVGQTVIFGHPFTTTGALGWTDQGSGQQGQRAFPYWITLPGSQNLADGRMWHFFFAWVLSICGIAYIIGSIVNGNARDLVLRRADLPKLLPMQLYYMHLRPNAPPHGKYNPLQKLAYTLIVFVFSPLIVITGLTLSPGVDSVFQPLTAIFGGRQFARLWHFVLTLVFFGFFFMHMALVLSTGVGNNLRSMITGKYRMKKYDGVGP